MSNLTAYPAEKPPPVMRRNCNFAGGYVPADKKVQSGRVRDESCAQIADRAAPSVIPPYTPKGKLVKSLAVFIGTFSA
jgi:hypothetical protein